MAERAASLLPALALARIDGSSPVEYLNEAEREIVRRTGCALLATPPVTLDELCERWAALAHPRAVPVASAARRQR
ncbi:MAG TPA: hypothetical protein VGL78_01280 [Solirubrobacteraceae bacterium]